MHKLIKLFNKIKINGYIIPKNDEYFNEYIDKSKDRLKLYLISLTVDLLW